MLRHSWTYKGVANEIWNSNQIFFYDKLCIRIKRRFLFQNNKQFKGHWNSYENQKKYHNNFSIDIISLIDDLISYSPSIHSKFFSFKYQFNETIFHLNYRSWCVVGIVTVMSKSCSKMVFNIIMLIIMMHTISWTDKQSFFNI